MKVHISISILLFAILSCTDLGPDHIQTETIIPEEWAQEGLNGIWGTSANNLYVVGMHGTIMNYNGTDWLQMNSNTSHSLYGIWGSGRDNIVAVGAKGTILHFNGSEWIGMDSPITSNINSIWGINRDNIYAVSSNGSVIHYDGFNGICSKPPLMLHYTVFGRHRMKNFL